jgi:hypothetical protein
VLKCPAYRETRPYDAFLRVSGAELASNMSDPGAATFYNTQANAILAVLPDFVGSSSGHVASSINVTSTHGERSWLDTGTILGVNYAGSWSDVWNVTNANVVATHKLLTDTMRSAIPLFPLADHALTTRTPWNTVLFIPLIPSTPTRHGAWPWAAIQRTCKSAWQLKGTTS